MFAMEIWTGSLAAAAHCGVAPKDKSPRGRVFTTTRPIRTTRYFVIRGFHARAKTCVASYHRQVCRMIVIVVRSLVRGRFAENMLTLKGELQDLHDALESLENGNAVCRESKGDC